MKLNTRKSKKINKKKRLSRKKNKTRQVSKRLKNMRKKTQKGGSEPASNAKKTDRCVQLLSYIRDSDPQFETRDAHYEDSNKNPYILSNLIAAIVNNCSENKKLDIKPLILLDENITDNIKDELDYLIIAIAKWLRKAQINDDDDEHDDDNNSKCGSETIPHYNEIVHNLKTEWFTNENVNTGTKIISPEFKEVIKYLFNKGNYENYENLKNHHTDDNIKCIFIKVYGEILLEEFYTLKSGKKEYAKIKWHKQTQKKKKGGANTNINNLKNKGRIMGFGYKIAHNMLYGKLPEQKREIDDGYSSWFNEIDTNPGILSQLKNNSVIKKAYGKIRKSQEGN